MEDLSVIILFLFVLFLLLGTGVWVGLALLGVAYVGMELFTTRPVGDTMLTTIWSASSSWTLTALPMFIWMGEILYRTRLSEDMFRGLSPWMARLPGGLVHTNIVGCTVFAAVSGSSAATLTTVGKMSIPELRKREYPERLVIGTLAGAATLGLMIPPSLTLIVYGVTINESITKLFIAGILPGLVLAGMFMAYVAIYSQLAKNYQPKPEPRLSFAEKVKNSRFLLPVFSLIFVVIGSMYLGFATATEAAAFGVIGSLILAAGQGSLDWRSFSESLMGATRTSAMIALILAGAAFLSLAMGFTGLPRSLADGIAQLGADATSSCLMVLLVFYIILGMFLGRDLVGRSDHGGGRAHDPRCGHRPHLVRHLHRRRRGDGADHAADRFNLFVLQGMTDHEMNFIARAALPMFLIMVLMVFVLIAFPDLATWLPDNMRPGPV